MGNKNNGGDWLEKKERALERIEKSRMELSEVLEKITEMRTKLMERIPALIKERDELLAKDLRGELTDVDKERLELIKAHLEEIYPKKLSPASELGDIGVEVHGVPAIEIPEMAFTGRWMVDKEVVKILMKGRFGDIHVCNEVAFKVKGSDGHGWVCTECGKVSQWG